MSDNFTEELTIEGQTYRLRTRLGWYDLKKVSDKAFQMFAEGKALTEADDLGEIKLVQISPNSADHDLARLRARLIGMNRNKIMAIPSPHVAILIEAIEGYEEEQEAEEAELMEGNPTGTP